jgi:hypothetical protein
MAGTGSGSFPVRDLAILGVEYSTFGSHTHFNCCVLSKRKHVSHCDVGCVPELHVSQVMRQTAEMFGGMGVKVCFQKVPLPLGSQTFASVRRFSFIVLTQDEQTRCYLQQASRKPHKANPVLISCGKSDK